MKKLVTLILCCVMLMACNTPSNNSSREVKRFAGKYNLDTSALLEQMKDDESMEDNPFAYALAAMLLESMKIDATFYEDGKGFMEFSGAAMNLVQAFASESIGTTIEFTYTIENDSILCIQGEEVTRSVIRKTAGHYDHFTLISEDGTKIPFTRIGETE